MAVENAEAWAAHERAGPATDSDRLAWPMAVVVIVSLSVGLWLGIGLIARLAVG